MRFNGNVDFEWRDRTPWLILVGEVDIDAVEPISDAVLAEYQTAGELRVDLRDVTFLDSLGVGLLLRLRQFAGSVCLVDVPHDVLRLLQLCGVEALFALERAAA